MLSLTPQYANAVLSGQKTLELRRRFTMQSVDTCAIYESRLRKAIVGVAEVGSVYHLRLSELWTLADGSAVLSYDDFCQYFNGLDFGFGIELMKPTKMHEPVAIREMYKRFRIRPPQSFCFAPTSLETQVKKTLISSY